MTTSPDLGLPFIATQQSQPEVSHNQAIAMLSALTKGVLSIGDNAPPGSPSDGDTYILGAAPTGAWAGKANKFAIYLTNAWVFVPGNDSSGTDIPIGSRHYGLRAWVQDIGGPYIWNGTAWVPDTTLVLTADNVVITPPDGSYADDAQGAFDELYAAIQSILDAGVGAGGISDANSDGTPYVRQNMNWLSLDATIVPYDGIYAADVGQALDLLFAIGGGGGGGGGLSDAPSDGSFYGRRNSGWENPLATDVSYSFDYGATVEAALDYLLANGGSGGSSEISIQNEWYRLQAEASITIGFGTSGTLFDEVVDKGGLVILALFGSCQGTTWRTGTSYVVPTGKKAILVDAKFDKATGIDANNSFFKARLYNVTQATCKASPSQTNTGSGADAVFLNGTMPANSVANNSDISYPTIQATAGDSIRAEIAGGSDGTSRPVFSMYILAIVDNTSGLMDPVI